MSDRHVTPEHACPDMSMDKATVSLRRPSSHGHGTPSRTHILSIQDSCIFKDGARGAGVSASVAAGFGRHAADAISVAGPKLCCKYLFLKFRMTGIMVSIGRQ